MIEPGPQSDVAAPHQCQRPPCAVCIDDDADYLSVLSRYLNDFGVSAIAATNAILGVRTIQRELPDFVVLDYQMPNAHGSYVLRCLQQDEALSVVPVIVVTGCTLGRFVEASQTLEQQLRRLGAYCVLRKPLNLHSLNAAVHKCLSLRFRHQTNSRFASLSSSTRQSS